jgi:two-component system OmpR family response regulator
MRVLVVEDEQQIADDIADALTEASYVVETVANGEDAWFRSETEDFDAIVLDLGLPRLDGLTVVRRLRASAVGTPILILSARGSWNERVEGIDAGADDYVTKPFHVEELVSRLSAIIRRSAGHASAFLEAGPIRIDTRRLAVTLFGRSVHLSSLEFRALRYLVHHKGRVVSQGELTEHVYASEREPDSNAVEVLVGRLRRKLGPETVLTRRGQGYLVEG